MIRKIKIRNYRVFRELDIDLKAGVNVLVGANDSGKSTLIEAINLALTGRVHGRTFAQELSPYFVNMEATKEYIATLRSGKPAAPPSIIIELFLDDDADSELLRGTNNLLFEDACGIRIQATFSSEFEPEYKSFTTDAEQVHLPPTEYYRVDWLGFSGNAITSRSVHVASSLVDPSTLRLQAGVDHHLQQIIRTHLEPKERVELSREYRSLRETFAGKEGVKAVNTRLQESNEKLTHRSLSLGVDISQRYTWESGLVAHLDEVPIHFASKGEQSAVKTLLALGRKAEGAHVVLIEEPEAHLSFGHLAMLMKRIEAQCAGKQVIVATHSNYVLNKLGLENMVLLGDKGAWTRFSSLPSGTANYFKKLPGYDTLRLILAKAAILVEGPSDELVVQRGYLDSKKKLPIEDGIDVISVGLSHKRFLDLAVRLKRRVWVVRDNDGKSPSEVEAQFSEYMSGKLVSIHIGEDETLRTLEPQIVAANSLVDLNAVLGKEFQTKGDACDAMLADKTSAALAIFESSRSITMPAYIRNVYEQQ